MTLTDGHNLLSSMRSEDNMTAFLATLVSEMIEPATGRRTINTS